MNMSSNLFDNLSDRECGSILLELYKGTRVSTFKCDEYCELHGFICFVVRRPYQKVATCQGYHLGYKKAMELSNDGRIDV